jgi:hypothetical protein
MSLPAKYIEIDVEFCQRFVDLDAGRRLPVAHVGGEANEVGEPGVLRAGLPDRAPQRTAEQPLHFLNSLVGHVEAARQLPSRAAHLER